MIPACNTAKSRFASPADNTMYICDQGRNPIASRFWAVLVSDNALTTIITHGCGIESRQPLYDFLGGATKAYQRVDKIHLAIVTEEHIVTMRSNIRDGHHPVSKEISILSNKSPLREQRLNLSFRRECFCPHGILFEHHTN